MRQNRDRADSRAPALTSRLLGAVSPRGSVPVHEAAGGVLLDRNLERAVGQGERAARSRVAVGDDLLVLAGEVVPVDGIITSPAAVLGEAAVTGEPIPVNRRAGELTRSGTVNAGETFELRASATAGESTYAGIVRMVGAAHTAKPRLCVWPTASRYCCCRSR